MEQIPNNNSAAREALLNPSQPKTAMAVEQMLNMINASPENLDVLDEGGIKHALEIARDYAAVSDLTNAMTLTERIKEKKKLQGEFEKLLAREE